MNRSPNRTHRGRMPVVRRSLRAGRRRGLPASVLLLSTAVWIALILPGPARAEQPSLTDEEIVRMVLAGTPETAILEEIDRREPAFDLSEEMIEELRIAGVSATVLQAMEMRQKETEKESVPAATGESFPTEQPPALMLQFETKKPFRPPGPLLFPEDLPRELEKEFGLDGGESGLKVTGAAVFVLCTASTHVPSYWRGNSPLGRDFHSIPRHRVLWFERALGPDRTVPPNERGEAESSAAAHRPHEVRLEIPGSVRVELEPEESHDLLIGIAVETGGRMMSLATVAVPNVKAGPKDQEIVVRATQNRKRPFQVRLERPDRNHP